MTRQALPASLTLTALCPSSDLSAWGIYCLWFGSTHMACAYVSETQAVQLCFLKCMLLKKKEKDPGGFTIFHFHAFYKLMRGRLTERDWGVWRSQDTGGSCPEFLPLLEFNFPEPWAVLDCSPIGIQKSLLNEWMAQRGPRALFIELYLIGSWFAEFSPAHQLVYSVGSVFCGSHLLFAFYSRQHWKLSETNPKARFPTSRKSPFFSIGPPSVKTPEQRRGTVPALAHLVFFWGSKGKLSGAWR